MKRDFTVSYIVRTGVLLALTLMFQIGFNGLGQGVVGPLVNFSLLISVVLVGTIPAIIIGCLTPLIAFMVGIMPLFPLVPFIMIGNSILVIIFHIGRKKISKMGDYIGLVIAAFGKFIFLAISVRYLVGLFIPKVPGKLVTALTLPQLYTALIGGILTLIVIKLLPNNMFIEKNN